jgi:hypothetical protein
MGSEAWLAQAAADLALSQPQRQHSQVQYLCHPWAKVVKACHGKCALRVTHELHEYHALAAAPKGTDGDNSDHESDSDSSDSGFEDDHGQAAAEPCG